MAAADQLLINQSGIDKRVTADKFAIVASGVWSPVDSGIPAGPPLNRWTNSPPADSEFQAYRVRARLP